MSKILVNVLLLLCIHNAINAQASLKNSLNNGRLIYQKNCLTCHQASGGGVPKMNPPLVHASFVNGDKTKLIKWVLLGSTEKVPIDGKYYSNNMPGQANLKDQDVADVLTFIRNNFKNKAAVITAAEVKAVRSEVISNKSTPGSL